MRGAEAVTDAILWEGVGKRYADVRALDGLDLAVRRGETLAVIGRSGCGKTTALRLVNRLEEPTSGRVVVRGRDVREWDPIRLRRSIGYVIQAGGLFPHRTIADNVGVLLELEGREPAERLPRVHELLELVRLDPTEFASRYPSELSGGQRQRVGIARALALDPDLLLLDEPFGALDPITRRELWREFQTLARETQKTILIVTHDLEEAFYLGDRVALLENGALAQAGTEAELTGAPASALVERFLEDLRV